MNELSRFKRLYLHVFMLVLLGFCHNSFGQENGYFVLFTNKYQTGYSFSNPSAYLSERAILRRQNQSISIDSTDLPVSRLYVDNLVALGVKVRHTSKWHNGAIIFSSNKAQIDAISALKFVKSVELIKEGAPILRVGKTSLKSITKTSSIEADVNYGKTYLQLQTVNGIELHQQGFKGAGMHIAILDAGFYKYNTLNLTKHLDGNGQILGVYDFVDPNTNVDEDHTHGMNVLSIMAGYSTDEFIGSAPDASYWLFRTEDVTSEYPIEADYWVCAAEKADSAGVDVINSSLGYFEYDNSKMNLNYSNLNGMTRISFAANMAVSKGILVVNSAGNEGSTAWGYIITPADASNVIAVGAMRSDSVRASFSSFGPNANKQIKPDVTAMGVNVALQTSTGSIGYSNGTSYSAPVVAGLAACYWQKNRSLTSLELVQALRQMSHLKTTPNNYVGYGVPNFNISSLGGNLVKRQIFKAYPNPFISNINVVLPIEISKGTWGASIYDLGGKVVYQSNLMSKWPIELDDIAFLNDGIYLLQIKVDSEVFYFRIVKH